MKGNKRIYIAGKVSGLPENEVREKFLNKERELVQQGFDVVNPCGLLTVRACTLQPGIQS